MKTAATTKMSSKGQIVIPESVRSKLGLKPGVEFYVVGDNDVIVLKTINYPDMRDFDALIAKARKQAAEAGLKRADITKAIKKARKHT